MLTLFLTTLALVFVAELGDKTQVLVAWLASRYRPWQVMAGIVIGSGAIHGLAVIAGVMLGAVVPGNVIEVAAGLLFLAFAILAFREARKDDEDEAEKRDPIGERPILGTAGVFFIAELGDKTQIMVITLAAQAASEPSTAAPGMLIALWAGAVAAMALSDGLAVVAGVFLGKRIRRQTLAWISGVLFALFGVFTLGSAILG